MPLLPDKNAAPPLTEKNLPDQTDKVFLITGGNARIGAELAEILYSKNANIYIAARSSSKSQKSIQSL